MLPTIPPRLLTDTLTLSVPTGFDAYQTATAATYTVYHCHLQNTNETRKTADNTEVVLRSVLFVDARISFPVLDYWMLQQAAQAAGGQMVCTVTDKAGHTSGSYTVQTVDAVPDDAGNVHHWELGLV